MSEPTPYVPQEPGDLVTADAWNEMQEKIYADIRASSTAAAEAITHVASADDAAHLGGLDIAALTDEVIRRVLDDARGRTGYQQLFKVLKGTDVTVIEHGLGTAPLVDLYQLEYFEVATREDDETRASFATFYLCQAEERRVRVPNAAGTGRRAVDIQPPDGPDLGIPLAEMLTRYEVPYSDTSSLDDLETEFWQAFFADPNDRFNDDQYSHSPWFERCCKEKQTVKKLKDNGDWDDILFIMHPRKTVNFAGIDEGGDGEVRLPRPADVGVQHLDDNRTALWFRPPHRADTGLESRARLYINDPSSPVVDPDSDDVNTDVTGRFERELKLMVLLKV
ncbi:MAG: hypothetical protein ACYC1Z_04970 [Georgenia sp.]